MKRLVLFRALPSAGTDRDTGGGFSVFGKILGLERGLGCVVFVDWGLNWAWFCGFEGVNMGYNKWTFKESWSVVRLQPLC